MDRTRLQEIAEKRRIPVDQVQRHINLAEKSMIPLGKRIETKQEGTRWHVVTRLGAGCINTSLGRFTLYDFMVDDNWYKYSVLVKAELDDELMPQFSNLDELLLRIDSGCETGQLFEDKSCDCRQQLHLAMQLIEERGEGLIINIPRQDGRGMGLPFKLATLHLQTHLGLNTVEAANEIAPHNVIDIRNYAGAIAILKFFGIPQTCRILLATNNREKLPAFRENGYKSVDIVSAAIPPTEETAQHLHAKRTQLGHLLPNGDQ